MTSEESVRNRAADDAAEWVIRLMHDTSPEAAREFAAWRAEHPDNGELFEAIRQTWRHLGELDRTFEQPDKKDSRCALVELPIDRKAGPLVRWLAEQKIAQVRRGHRRKMWGFSVAAAIGILSVGYTLMSLAPWGVERYTTPIGSQQTVKLSDGSMMQLNTHSTVEVRFKDDMRDVRLVEGEALFTVAPDSRRPFYVSTDNARVRAIGTKFNVYRKAFGTTYVAVLEGVVQVSTDSAGIASAAARVAGGKGDGASRQGGHTQPFADVGNSEGQSSVVRLSAGSAATVIGESIKPVEVADVQRSVVWQTRKLVFEIASIDDIAAEFNRYNQTRIVILDEAIGSRRMAGTFEADDPSPVIGYLSRDPSISVTRVGAEIRIALRAP